MYWKVNLVYGGLWGCYGGKQKCQNNDESAVAFKFRRDVSIEPNFMFIIS
jgi:hypothetical protein